MPLVVLPEDEPELPPVEEEVEPEGVVVWLPAVPLPLLLLLPVEAYSM